LGATARTKNSKKLPPTKPFSRKSNRKQTRFIKAKKNNTILLRGRRERKNIHPKGKKLMISSTRTQSKLPAAKPKQIDSEG
jgi:hypothetical protein